MDALRLTTTPGVGYAVPSEEEIKVRNLAARKLLREWETDASGYEEENAEAIERALKDAPLSLRDDPIK